MNLHQRRAELQSDIARSEAERAEAKQAAEAAALDRHHLSPVEHHAQRAAAFQARQQERDDRAEQELKADLRRRYLSTPGATVAAFEEAYPALVEEHRRKVALGEAPAAEAPYSDPARWGLRR